LANKLFSRDGCNKNSSSNDNLSFPFLGRHTKNLSSPFSESQFQTFGVMAENCEGGAKLLIKLNCLPCVFASPDAPTMANSKDNRRWEQQEDFGFPKRKILQPQQQFSWLATANYDGIFTFGLVKCAANLVYEIL